MVIAGLPLAVTWFSLPPRTPFKGVMPSTQFSTTVMVIPQPLTPLKPRAPNRRSGFPGSRCLSMNNLAISLAPVRQGQEGSRPAPAHPNNHL